MSELVRCLSVKRERAKKLSSLLPPLLLTMKITFDIPSVGKADIVRRSYLCLMDSDFAQMDI